MINNKTIPEKMVYTEHELATKLGISYWSVRSLRIKNKLPHFRTAGKVFYRWTTVIKWLDEQETASTRIS